MKFPFKILHIIAWLILLWLGGFGLFAASSLMMKPQQVQEKTDAIVVLTGGSKRIETGLQLLAAGNAGILFISGVHTDVPTDTILKMWTGGLDKPVCCVELGRKAQTTSENAQETQEWMEKKKFSSLRLVTSNYHMHRAMLEISNALPDAVIIPHAVIQTDISADSLHMWMLLFSEYHKTIARWMAFTFGLPVTGGTS